MVIGIDKERFPARWEGRAVDGITMVLSSDDSLTIHCIQDRLVLPSEREREKERVREQGTEVLDVSKCHNEEELIAEELHILNGYC